MGKVSGGAAKVYGLEYQREADPKEAELVARYAADLGTCIYVWNRAISSSFLIYASTFSSDDKDPQRAWDDIRGDTSRIRCVAARFGAGDQPEFLRTEVAWLCSKLEAAAPVRNSIVHIGIAHAPGSVAPDPYATRTTQTSVVEEFLKEPSRMGDFSGDLRVLGQFADHLSMLALYPAMSDEHRCFSRPQLLYPALI